MKKTLLALALSIATLGTLAPTSAAMTAPAPRTDTPAVADPSPRGGDEGWCEKCVKKVIEKHKDKLKGDTGETGPAGPAGPAGATGPAGPAGAAGKEGVPKATQVVNQEFTVAAKAQSIQTIACPAGTTVTGGGFVSALTATISYEGSRPDGNGWRVSTVNVTDSEKTFTAYAVCLPLS
jgi:hypothetical protein